MPETVDFEQSADTSITKELFLRLAASGGVIANHPIHTSDSYQRHAERKTRVRLPGEPWRSRGLCSEAVDLLYKLALMLQTVPFEHQSPTTRLNFSGEMVLWSFFPHYLGSSKVPCNEFFLRSSGRSKCCYYSNIPHLGQVVLWRTSRRIRTEQSSVVSEHFRSLN